MTQFVAAPTTELVSTPAWPILGQERAVALLHGAIMRESVAHAYIFAGPAQSGRATLARLFAQALNCEGVEAPRGLPCGNCRSCRKIERGTHPDVRVVGLASQEASGSRARRESKNTSLSIETVRDLCADLSLRPMEGNWRVAIVEDAATMQEAAANAFLKTLEEPPSFAVIILIVPEVGTVLPTIRSRCQVIETRPVPREELAAALQRQHVLPQAEARTLAALSRGRAGWAIAAAGQPSFFEERRATFAAMFGLLNGPSFDFFPLVDRLTDRFRKGRRDEVYAELDAWLGLWRDLLLLRTGCGELLLNVDYADHLRPLAARFTLAHLRDAASATTDALRWLDENVAPRLALEALVLRWQNDT